MDEKFTIDEFRQYLFSQDSLGDVLYNLSVENVKASNVVYKDEDEEK